MKKILTVILKKKEALHQSLISYCGIRMARQNFKKGEVLKRQKA
jgi:hypothetical protein